MTDERFPLRIVIRTPSGGIGEHHTMRDWLNENCGIGGWSLAPPGAPGLHHDAIAVSVGNPTCALAFMARWCLPGDHGLYEFRQTDSSR
jgi:hypothetical protein